jgi:RsiW-degrading membrane proteinase PrsW (M82 family)
MVNSMALQSLMGHLLYGLALGLGFVLVARRVERD